MLKWTITFFIIAILGATLGFGDIAAGVAYIAKAIFYIFTALVVICLIFCATQIKVKEPR